MGVGDDFVCRRDLVFEEIEFAGELVECVDLAEAPGINLDGLPEFVLPNKTGELVVDNIEFGLDFGSLILHNLKFRLTSFQGVACGGDLFVEVADLAGSGAEGGVGLLELFHKLRFVGFVSFVAGGGGLCDRFAGGLQLGVGGFALCVECVDLLLRLGAAALHRWDRCGEILVLLGHVSDQRLVGGELFLNVC